MRALFLDISIRFEFYSLCSHFIEKIHVIGRVIEGVAQDAIDYSDPKFHILTSTIIILCKQFYIESILTFIYR